MIVAVDLAVRLGLFEDDDEDDGPMYSVNDDPEITGGANPLSHDRMTAPCPLCGKAVEYWLNPLGPDHDLYTVTWCLYCDWMGDAMQLLAGDEWGIFPKHPVTGAVKPGQTAPLGTHPRLAATS